MNTGTILLVVGGILTLLLAPLFAFPGSCVADMKGRSRVVCLILCGLFFPMVMLLFLLARKKGNHHPHVAGTERKLTFTDCRW